MWKQKLLINKHMRINTQNYEQFFIDFIEGNLSSDQEAELHEFVRSHTYLQNEFNELKNLILIPEDISFKNKELLKVNKNKAINGISKTERLSIAYLENEIEPKEKKELFALLENKANKKTFETIKKTKLLPENQYFKNKNKLKKQINSKLFYLSTKKYYRIAALILLLLSITFFMNNNKNTLHFKHELIVLEQIPLRKTENKTARQIAIIKAENINISYKKNEDTIKNILPLAENIPESIHSKNIIQLVISDKMNNANISAISTLQVYNAQTKTKKLIIPSREKTLQTLKEKGKEIGYRIVYSFRKNIKYRKIYINDNQVLIAFKAGEYEFKKIKTLNK